MLAQTPSPLLLRTPSYLMPPAVKDESSPGRPGCGPSAARVGMDRLGAGRAGLFERSRFLIRARAHTWRGRPRPGLVRKER